MLIDGAGALLALYAVSLYAVSLYAVPLYAVPLCAVSLYAVSLCLPALSYLRYGLAGALLCLFLV